MLFEHLMMIWAPGGPQMTSPCVGNLDFENAADEGGTRVESLKKPKKPRRIMAFSVVASCKRLAALNKSPSLLTVIMPLILTARGAL